MKKSPSFVLRAMMSLLLASGTSGCSFIFVKPPPAHPSSTGPVASRVSSPDCTSSRLAPGFDTAFGALQLVRTGLAATASDSVYDSPSAPLSREADVALGVGFMALFVSSAIYGFVNTSSCSRLKNGDDYDPQSPPESPETWSASTPEKRPAEPLPAVALQPEPAPGAPPPPPEAIADPPSDAASTPGDADPGKAP